MTLVRVMAPPAAPVSIEEAKTHLNVESAEFDDYIGSLIEVATQALDGSSIGTLGRALIQQTWDLRLDCFRACIEIPMPPLQSVTSIKYLDQDGAEQTLDPALYRVVGMAADWPAKIKPAYQQSWPATYPVDEAVIVRFVCGYAPSGDPIDYAKNVPAPIKQAILLEVGDLFAKRETSLTALDPTTVTTVERLLAPIRVHTFA